MEGSMIDLSKYRFQSAKENLETAQLPLAEFDSSKHSGVIAFFNRTYAICFLLSREIKGLESHHELQPFCFLLSVLQSKIICVGV